MCVCNAKDSNYAKGDTPLKNKTLRFLLLIALIFSLVTPSTRAHAATFIVTTLIPEGSGSLQQAIIDANAAVGADTINFSVSGMIPAWSTLPPITDPAGLTIDGAGQTVTISGMDVTNVLYVDLGASLTLNNLTISNGANDSAPYSYGGGIHNYGGTVTITNSTFSGNSAYSGGGVFNYSGMVTIKNSTFSGNSTTGGQGGGIFNYYGTITITNSTFSGNSVYSGGGFGAAIYNDGTMSISNTIIANSVYGANCSGGAITNGGNNIDDSISCGWGSTSGSMSNTNPLLGVLADNGGPTQTFALLAGSLAIDGVTYNPPNSAPPTDQRGVARPQGVRYDIGAYESTYQSGSTFVVNALADSDDMVCEDAPGDCTLREAINAAKAFAGPNTITFSVSGTITLGSELPFFDDAAGLTIDGTGQTVTISGNNAVGVLYTGYSASLTLIHLTIANGNSVNGSGSGINNNGTLTIANCTFSGNTAKYVGGSIANNGTLTITNSAFSGNSSNNGGGISNYINHTLSITNSIFSDNSASQGGGGVDSYNGTVTITNSTFSGNSAGSVGGGVSAGGTLNITNSTFSGNTAGYRGGGIASDSTLTITNSTFSGNTAPYGGGGIWNIATVNLLNTILADNTGGNCHGAVTNGGNNIDDGTTCGWGSTNGSMSGADPLLASLAENGGPTQTFALLMGSPAIDGVTYNSPNSAPPTDQRGVARPQGVRYDIGSYESVLPYLIYFPLLVFK
jgi:fibronectin-binding autotransporter adhesin